MQKVLILLQVLIVFCFAGFCGGFFFVVVSLGLFVCLFFLHLALKQALFCSLLFKPCIC